MFDSNRVSGEAHVGLKNQDYVPMKQMSLGQSDFVFSISTLHNGEQAIPRSQVFHNMSQNPIKQEKNASQYYGRDVRVRIPYCEIDIVHGCNLRCEQCSHVSPYRGGFSTKEDIIGWLERWSQKIYPNVINLLGGEPLLHPDLVEIIRGSRRVFPNSKIEVTTNGLLLPHLPPVVFEVFREEKVKVFVSDHSSNDVPFQQIMDSVELLRKQKVDYVFRNSKQQWHTSYRWNGENLPIPFRSNPRLAWLTCDAKNCKSLMNNRFYKCSILANIAKSVEEGVLSPTLWKTALTYKPLTLDSTLEEIASHFNTRAIPECCNCPEHFTFVENKQLPISRLETKQLHDHAVVHSP
jgi:uncharacterized Fe-S cluster-containing radical SAM superfamily protein